MKASNEAEINELRAGGMEPMTAAARWRSRPLAAYGDDVTESASPVLSLRALSAWMFWAAALVALVMALLPHPPQFLDASDTSQHMLAFAVLAGLAALAWPHHLLAIGLGLFGFGGLIELLQMIPGLHRDGQVGDWTADAAATIAVLLLAAVMRGRSRRTS